MTQSLIDGGMNAETARATASLIALGAAATAGGVAGGGVQGATTAANIDLNNRQLHPVETKRIQELAQGDPQKEARLIEAACALVRCADGVPTDDPNYSYLKALQDAGGNLAAEQKLLLQQSSRPGDLTRTFGPLFRYSWVDEYLLDPASQNNIGTRLAGAAQGGVGIVGVIGSGALCTTGWGCAAGALTGTISGDYAQAGIRQGITGNATVPYGEQVLQSLGMSPQAAAITYGVLGIAPAAVEAAVINKAVNAQIATNAATRQSYEPIASFGAQGIKPTPLVMQSSQAQAIVNEYVAAGSSPSQAISRTRDLIETGTTMSISPTVGQGVELIKVVPKAAIGGDGVSTYTPFFVTRQEFESLSKLPANEIAQRLGLPAEQGVRGSQLGFDVYAIKPQPGITPKVFFSKVAPIQQGSYSASGGAQQVLVPNRSVWTEAIKIGSLPGVR